MSDVAVPVEELEDLVFKALVSEANGLREDDARVIAGNLMYAERRRNNQGVIKVVTGALKASEKEGDIEIVKSTPVSAKIVGNDRIGMIVMKKALDVALEKAAANGGVAIISCTGYRSATGALGYWTRQAAEKGYICFLCCQCPEMVAPHGSYEAIFGTNPMAFSFPSGDEDPPVTLDMATSSAAWYHLKQAEADGKEVDGSLAYDNQGHSTTDPSAALKGALKTFGGAKGSGLALMVELLAGSLSGADMENKWSGATGWGSFMMVINPGIMGDAEEITSSAKTMLQRIKSAKKLDSADGVFLPGERSDLHERETAASGTIPVSESVLARLRTMANEGK
jgi:LDH2 family malate/lactate/ureidoglycolate dehydrogenase